MGRAGGGFGEGGGGEQSPTFQPRTKTFSVTMHMNGPYVTAPFSEPPNKMATFKFDYIYGM